MDDEVPDSTTLCRFRNALVKSGVYDRLLWEVNRQLEALRVMADKGYGSAENRGALSRMKLKGRIMHNSEVIGRCINFYNTCRPHMSIGNNTPEMAHNGRGEQKRLWKRKKRRDME